MLTICWRKEQWISEGTNKGIFHTSVLSEARLFGIQAFPHLSSRETLIYSLKSISITNSTVKPPLIFKLRGNSFFFFLSILTFHFILRYRWLDFPDGASGNELTWRCRRREMQVRSLGWENPLEGMTTHSTVLVWKIPWTEEPGGLQPMGSQRVGHDWSQAHTWLINNAVIVSGGQQRDSAIHTCIHSPPNSLPMKVKLFASPVFVTWAYNYHNV